uniref:Uncharacterized protein n=1 Tax=Salvator merianae TaxID=96440 RepID=A0A8D0E6N3_SALMN
MRNRAPPMTWEQLRQQAPEETPENLMAAVFAVITANSVIGTPPISCSSACWSKSPPFTHLL